MASSGRDSDDCTAAAVEEDYNDDTVLSDDRQPQQTLSPSQKKALQVLRAKLEASILHNDLLNSPEKRTHHHHHRRRFRRINSAESSAVITPGDVHAKNNNNAAADVELLKEISLWGVPLLPSKDDEGTDLVLLKFLRARDFKPSKALEMIRKTLRWRRDVDVERILSEDLGLPGLDGMAYLDGVDREGRPVCYHLCGAFKDGEFCQKMLGYERLLRWRVKVMERVIERLRFDNGGVGSFVHVVDLKNAPGAGVKGLQVAMKKVISVLMDNYPEFVVKNIFVNVSFRFYAQYSMLSNLTPRTKSKFMFVRPSKVAEKLLKFIAPEELPIQYGGLKRGDDEFPDGNIEVSEVVIRPGGTETIVIPVDEAGVTVVWDATVVGWEVGYKEEFIPNDECLYRVLIQEEKKLEESVRNSFYISDPGKIVLTIENKCFKKKKALYRWKTKPRVSLYNIIRRSWI